MLASVFILTVSGVLLVYWFRYTCLMLLDSKPASEHAGSADRANHLAFLDVQQALASGSPAPLDALHRSLENDYRILLYLLRHSGGQDFSALERRLLALDYAVMRVWYRLVRRSSAAQARQALLEMARVLGYFSQKIGERAAQHAAS